MKLSNEKLIREFYKRYKDEYPDISLEQMKEICFTPWRYVKRNMESGELPKIRLKYFGTFQVYEGKARGMLHDIKRRFKFNKIHPKQYFKLKEMLEKYLEQFEDKKEL